MASRCCSSAGVLGVRHGCGRGLGRAGQGEGVDSRRPGVLIANDLAVPDLSAIGVAKPVSVSLPVRQCTKEKLGALRQVLSKHPGTADVHVKLIGSRGTSLWKVDEVLRVEPSSSLMGDLKALLGPSCLAG